MSDDPKKIEARAYSRGYAAGSKRKAAIRADEHVQRERMAFLDRAFLAALPSAMSGSWSRGKVPIKSIEDRVKLAWEMAEAALKQRRH